MEREVTILIVEDDADTRAALAEQLASVGYRVRSATTGAEGLDALQGPAEIDAVLLDLALPDMDGFELLKRNQEHGSRAAVVVLSGHCDTNDVVRAMRLGASDYLQKPCDPHELELVLRRALDHRVTRVGRAATVTLDPANEALDAEKSPATLSDVMEHVWSLARRVADTDVPILLVGESGVGKDVVARRLHAMSRRAGGPFIKINCAALPGELLESELFGHERGAFTGAHAEKPGKFELAHRGSIFLDEIGEMDPRLQAKLLQVLQDEEFYRVGGTRSIQVDARVIVATNRDLEDEIASGRFREDLYYRLNVVTLQVPPLRDRKEDIIPLAHHFFEKYTRRYSGGLDRIPDDLMERFHAHTWPGNVRELENLVRRLVVLKDPAMVFEELVPHRARASLQARGMGAQRESPAPPPAVALHALSADDSSLRQIGRRAARIAEREAILRALMRTGWNKRKAALRLHISYKAVLYKIKDCKIVDPRDQAQAAEASPLRS